MNDSRDNERPGRDGGSPGRRSGAGQDRRSSRRGDSTARRGNNADGVDRQRSGSSRSGGRAGGPRPDERRSAGQRGEPRPGGSKRGLTARSKGGNGPEADEVSVDRSPDPEIDPDVTGEELGEDVLAEFSSLSGGMATRVAQHLVMASALLDEDPQMAHEHALAARRRTARVGLVREVVGVTAYAAGEYAEALAELRAARRITGSEEYLPMMADCERGLGRPRRALELASDPAVERLDKRERIEMFIVAAGARRDLGETDAAVVALQVPELRSNATDEWVPRLRYAYADALEAAGRPAEAARWFARAAEVDAEGLTDAAERAAALDSSAS